MLIDPRDKLIAQFRVNSALDHLDYQEFSLARRHLLKLVEVLGWRWTGRHPDEIIEQEYEKARKYFRLEDLRKGVEL